MRAVRVRNGSPIVVEVPEPTGDGVLVRVAQVGICGTDQVLVERGITATLGHEFAGWLTDGTPVAVEPFAPCGSCDRCVEGNYNTCADGFGMVLGIGRDGAMADLCQVPPRAIVPLATDTRPGDGCLVEPLAVAVHAVRRGAIVAGHRVAVVGAGTVGLCAIPVIRAAAAEVHIAARHTHQRVAAEKLGGGIALTDGYDVVIEATGTQAGFQQAVAVVRSGGRIVLVGGVGSGLVMEPGSLFNREIVIIPSIGYSRTGPSRDIDVAASLLSSVPGIAETLITHRFPLEEVAEAFATARDRAAGAIKVVVEP